MAKLIERLPRKIVIPHEELHSDVKEGVESLGASRKGRLKAMFWSAGFHSMMFGTLTTMGYLALRKEGIVHSFGEYYSPDLASGLGVFTLGGTTLGYLVGSGRVRERTKALATTLQSVAHLDRQERFSVPSMNATHPIKYVNGKGDLVCVRPTRVQLALLKAQATKLGRFVPGRQRFRTDDLAKIFD
jgi:hypothetical protein